MTWHRFSSPTNDVATPGESMPRHSTGVATSFARWRIDSPGVDDVAFVVTLEVGLGAKICDRQIFTHR